MKITKIAITASLLALIILGCTPKAPAADTGPTGPAATMGSTTATAGSLATATTAPTATSTPPPEPTATSSTPWAGWATPAYVDPSTPVPFPVRNAGIPDGIDTYIALGSDKLPHRTSTNTDVIELVFVDKRSAPYHLSILSIPRDLYVFIPGYGMGRINTAYALGSDQAVFDTIEYNFGVRPKAMILGDMTAFIGFIDYLGGVDVKVTANVYDRCGDGTPVNYVAGTYHMSGQQALCYVRVREASSDYDRMRREQEVTLATMGAAIKSMATDPVGTASQIFDLYRNSVHTTFGLSDVPELALTAMKINRDSVSLYRFVPPIVTHWTKPTTGAWLLLPPPPSQIASLISFAAQGEMWPESTAGQ